MFSSVITGSIRAIAWSLLFSNASQVDELTVEEGVTTIKSSYYFNDLCIINLILKSILP
jgi:hypothetical protein